MPKITAGSKDLCRLSRYQIQGLAKREGIAANLKTTEIIRFLLAKCPGGVKLPGSGPASSSSHPRQTKDSGSCLKQEPLTIVIPARSSRKRSCEASASPVKRVKLTCREPKHEPIPFMPEPPVLRIPVPEAPVMPEPRLTIRFTITPDMYHNLYPIFKEHILAARQKTNAMVQRWTEGVPYVGVKRPPRIFSLETARQGFRRSCRG
ncbi:hypothetical protein C8J56DRAFT_153903 [Mycena floridula]|nr:hypothetical protein C8J56DRAFT_153903 [Mycena floridula]